MTAISLKGVSHTFDTRRAKLRALEDIDLEIGENEFVTLVGRSGCGKSTLLRLMAGLLRPTAGQVEIGGRAVTRPRRDVSLMFQRSALLPWRTVIENVMLPVEILRLDRRAHVHDPSVLLMDEPFAALDALTREELSLELQRIWGEERKTIVFVTHSIQEAALLADRIVVMTPRPGRLARMVEVHAPRPRSLGHSDHSDELDRVQAELHELLLERQVAPVGA